MAVNLIPAFVLFCAAVVLSNNSCPEHHQCFSTPTAQCTEFTNGESVSHVHSQLLKETEATKDQEDEDPKTDAVFFVAGVVSGILISMAAALIITRVYRKRWWIRYHYFITRRIWANSWKQEKHRPSDFRYDAFVSYNIHDKDWVNKILQPKLEDENGIRLCLNERDFELGGPISEQIIDSIEKSQKVLLILSPHFVRSNWCKFEMTMALQKLITKGHDMILLVILKPLDGVEITKTLKALLEQKTYVEWSEGQYG